MERSGDRSTTKPTALRGRALPPRSAYIHVPFCRHHCGYCNFTLVAGRDDLIAAYLEALAKCRRLTRDEGIDATMDKHQLDAILAPTSTPAHLTDWVTGDHGLGDSTTPAAVAGYPSITVPMGQVFGLPVGLSFFGRAWSEPRLLQIAFAFEQATKARRQPGFLPTIEPQG